MVSSLMLNSVRIWSLFDMNHNGRKAVVTGGASGLGADIAEALAASRASVVLIDVDESALELRRKAIPGSIGIRADVTDRAAVIRAVGEATAHLGGLDTLVICAGVIHIKPLGEVTEADWDRVLDVNLKGAFLTIQAAAPALAESGRGRIVAISSDAGRRGAPLIQAYAASKFGLVGLVESVAAELAPARVTANCVCPVGCPTTAMGRRVLDAKVAMTGLSPESLLAATARENPLGRNLAPSDVTSAVLFLASDAASFITGASLDVDGGLHLAALPGVGTELTR
jgi:NAD(P)-dependent dehydrogenase (short-subunit alcohol dehydrogenase family)